MPNPANEFSQAAKEAGLSYWDYMDGKYPQHVQHFFWGAKKITCKERREIDDMLLSGMIRSGNPRLRWLAQMRAILKGNSHY